MIGERSEKLRNSSCFPVKEPVDTVVGSDTGKLIGMPPTPTALTVCLDIFKFMEFRKPEKM